MHAPTYLPTHSFMCMQGRGEEIFAGCLALLAVFLVTTLAFAFLRMVNMEDKVRRKLQKAAEQVSSGHERVV
jgi:hypothetical protein